MTTDQRGWPDDPVQAAYAQIHDQDALRKYSVGEVKQIAYPLINAVEDAVGERDRLRKALLDMGVQPDIVDLIQNVGATIHIERTEPKEQP